MLYTEGQRQGLMIGGVKGRKNRYGTCLCGDISNNEIMYGHM